jgi:hypothetical protein
LIVGCCRQSPLQQYLPANNASEITDNLATKP